MTCFHGEYVSNIFNVTHAKCINVYILNAIYQNRYQVNFTLKKNTNIIFFRAHVPVLQLPLCRMLSSTLFSINCRIRNTLHLSLYPRGRIYGFPCQGGSRFGSVRSFVFIGPLQIEIHEGPNSQEVLALNLTLTNTQCTYVLLLIWPLKTKYHRIKYRNYLSVQNIFPPFLSLSDLICCFDFENWNLCFVISETREKQENRKAYEVKMSTEG